MRYSVKEGPGGRVTVTSPDNVDPKVLHRLGVHEMNKRRYARVAGQAFGFVPDVEDKDDLMKLGEVLRPIVYGDDDDDAAAGQRFIDWAEKQDGEFMDFFGLAQNHIAWYALARWAEQAFPVVTMGEKFCAALMATQIPAEMLAEVEAPWKSFVIEVPGRMLSIFDGEEMRRTRVVRILVHKTNHPVEPWRWLAYGELGQHVWRAGHAEQLLEPVKFRKRELAHYMGEALEDDVHRDERLYVLVSRLILNTCLVVADPDQVKPVGASHGRHGGSTRRTSGSPEQRVFQVGRPITLDCRAAIQEYVEGVRPAGQLKVQSLTRGHWRQQPHGPGMTLRRRQWIEPYWRGNEEAPILQRPYVIPED